VESGNTALPEAMRAWHAAHDAAMQAWECHNERLQATARAEAEGCAPPDSWLSEVRYRERARAELAQQAVVEQLLNSKTAELVALEVERGQVWVAFTSSYRGACGAACAQVGRGQSDAEAAGSSSEAAPWLPPPPLLRAPGLAAAAATASAGDAPVSAAQEPSVLPQVPDMPSAGGAVLQRLNVAMQAPAGLFGLGGGGWRDGATLVLTLHGYLHLFYMADAEKASAKVAGESNSAEEELVESAIKASVYVPMATKCMFLQKGKELVLEVSEPAEGTASTASPVPATSPGASFSKPPDETTAASPAAGSNSAGSGQGVGLGERASSGLRRLLGRPSGNEPLPRRIYAKVTELVDFRDLESRCQGFVRRGQGFRASVASPGG